jgi:hypothetical protein
MTSRLFVILLIIFFLILRLPSFFEPNWYGDEAIYLTLGWLQRLGFVVYRDFYDHKPPLILTLSAIFPTVLWAKLFISALLVPTLFYFYRLCLTRLTRPFSRLATVLLLIFASVPLFEGNIYNSEIINLCLIVFAFYSYFVRSNYLLPFFILGIAFTNKFPVLFDFLFLVSFILVNHPPLRSPKFLVRAVVMFLLPTIAFSFYFALNYSLFQFIKSAYLDNYFYISSWHTAGLNLFWRLAILVISLIGLLILSKRINPKKHLVLWLSAWFLIDLFASLLSARPYPHYLLQIVPSLVLLVVVSLSLRSRLFSLVGAGALLLLWLTFNLYQFYRYATFPYYQSFYSSATSGTLTPFTNYFGPHVSKISQLSNSLKSLVPPQSTLLLWGDWPQVYQLSGLVPALPYITSFHVTSLNARSQVINQILASPPSAIALLKPSPSFDALYDLVKKSYRLEVATSDYEIYLLR